MVCKSTCPDPCPCNGSCQGKSLAKKCLCHETLEKNVVSYGKTRKIKKGTYKGSKQKKLLFNGKKRRINCGEFTVHMIGNKVCCNAI